MHRRQQVSRMIGFGEIIIRAKVHADAHVGFVAPGREKNERGGREVLLRRNACTTP